MRRDRPADSIPKKERPVSYVSRRNYRPAPWLFRNRDLIHSLQCAEPVDQQDLTNRLNHIHFTNGHILVHLRCPQYEEDILARAYPEACLGREVTCRWSGDQASGIELKNYQFQHLIVDNGRSMILVPAVLHKIDKKGLRVELPLTSYAIGHRQARRYACQEVVVELVQSGFQARGKLVDYSPVGLRIRVRPEPSSSFRWLNSDARVAISLRHGQQILFSGICRCIREQGKLQEREIVLAPVDGHINRFKQSQFRNPRQHLVPSPTLIFDHPLFKKRIQREVYDISTSGFSVHEKADEAVLLPGMMIPELTINFSGTTKMKCAAQVIYRLEVGEERIRCGICILDMDINTYSRLASILTKGLDPHAYICSEVDMEALWEFFFDTGFINPKKYRLIQSYREDFKETYRRLYQNNPAEIARHFIYQNNERIYGHLSMVRAYERAWMIHHHAARSKNDKWNGLMVLKEIMHYLNDMRRLPSASMDYVMCYFRPDNRFPDLVFGGFARDLNKVHACSMDLFSYLPYTTLSLGAELPDGWTVEECSTLDVWELNRFYSHYSGGLLLDALNLCKKNSASEPLEKVYSRLGFLRKCSVYSLKHDGKLNAVMIVDQSDLAFNLSELLNTIKIMVVNPEGLPWNVLSTAISKLIDVYHMDRVPILFYPFDYVKAKNVPYEKQYQLWVLNVRYGNQYLEYMKRKFRISYE